MSKIIINPGRHEWSRLTQRPHFASEELEPRVKEIIDKVRVSGDEAVKEFTLKFDKVAVDNLWVSEKEIAQSPANVSTKLKRAILKAKKNIEKFHSRQVEKAKKIDTVPGVTCWRSSIAIQSVGLYIPGGSAPLFSTLLMLAIPAKIAGCENIVVATPPNKYGDVHPAILFVANILGIKNIYKSGGAQAIAAMAFGTQTLQKVDKIFGPGNQYVTFAKKMVQNSGVAIDMLAGPSELAVYADETSVVEFVAADLLSQAEHGPDSQVVLVAVNKEIIEKVVLEISRQMTLLPRNAVAERSLSHAHFIVMAEEVNAFDFLNLYAPEHLIIASQQPEKYISFVRNAGSVFLGNLSPESAGDYASGTNHSLPTSGFARTFSGVSVDSFVKKITFQKLSERGLKDIGTAVETMAEAEGLDAHKNAVSIRLKKIHNEKI